MRKEPNFWVCRNNQWYRVKNRDKFNIHRRKDDAQDAHVRYVHLSDEGFYIETEVQRYDAGPTMAQQGDKVEDVRLKRTGG